MVKGNSVFLAFRNPSSIGDGSTRSAFFDGDKFIVSSWLPTGFWASNDLTSWTFAIEDDRALAFEQARPLRDQFIVWERGDRPSGFGGKYGFKITDSLIFPSNRPADSPPADSLISFNDEVVVFQNRGIAYCKTHDGQAVKCKIPVANPRIITGAYGDGTFVIVSAHTRKISQYGKSQAMVSKVHHTPMPISFSTSKKTVVSGPRGTSSRE